MNTLSYTYFCRQTLATADRYHFHISDMVVVIHGGLFFTMSRHTGLMVKGRTILIICFAVLAFIIFELSGCGASIKPDTLASGEYSTQTPMTALEYSLYMNKQVTVFINQLTTRMTIIRNMDDAQYSGEMEMANHAVTILEAAATQVSVTKPPVGYEQDRLTSMTAMRTAIDHMKQYVDALRNEDDLKGFVDVFQNDVTELTSLANLYYQ